MLCESLESKGEQLRLEPNSLYHTRRTLGKYSMARDRQTIRTTQAPRAIGTYSQAIRAGTTVYISGQIPIDPETMELVAGDFRVQAIRVFDNLSAVCRAAGGRLVSVVKLTVYLVDLSNFSTVNDVMAEYFKEPYPARAAVGVSALPKEAAIEVDAVLHLPMRETPK